MQHKAQPLQVIEPNSPATKIAGWTLLIISLLSVFVMSHHPTIGRGEMSQQVVEATHELAIFAWVHGLMIALVWLTLITMVVYSQHRGLNKLAALTALVSFSLGVITMTGAGLMNGFAVPQLMHEYLGAPEDQLEHLQAILKFTRVLDNTLAELGVWGMSVGIVFWSINLFDKNRLHQVFGLLGLVIGIGACGALLTGLIYLDISGYTAIVIAHGIWYLCIAFLLITSSKLLEEAE